MQLCEHTHIYWADIEEHITACKGDTRINPSHEWPHAMDPDTYDPPHAED